MRLANYRRSHGKTTLPFSNPLEVGSTLHSSETLEVTSVPHPRIRYVDWNARCDANAGPERTRSCRPRRLYAVCLQPRSPLTPRQLFAWSGSNLAVKAQRRFEVMAPKTVSCMMMMLTMMMIVVVLGVLRITITKIMADRNHAFFLSLSAVARPTHVTTFECRERRAVMGGG